MEKATGSVVAATRSVPLWGLHEGSGAWICMICWLSQMLLVGEVEELL
jgi:hypothetical protein